MALGPKNAIVRIGHHVIITSFGLLLNSDKLYPENDYRNKEEKVGQDKPEKKPSTAARFARSIGMKRNEKETKLQNGDAPSTAPVIMQHHTVSRNSPKKCLENSH